MYTKLITFVLLVYVTIGAAGNSVSAQTKTTAAELVNTCYANQYSGADAGAKINAAIADKRCVVVDATNLAGAQAAAQTIIVDRSLLLQLSCSTYTLAGNPGIKVTAPGAAIIGITPYCTVLQTNSATADIIQDSGIFLRLEHIGFRSSVFRTAGAGLKLLAGIGDFRNLRFDKTFNGIEITDTKGGGIFRDITMGDGLSPTGNWNAGLIIGRVPSRFVTSSSFDALQINGGKSKFSDALIAIYDGADAISFTNTQAVFGGESNIAFKTDAVVGGGWPEWIKCTNCYFEAGPNADGVVINKGRHVEFDNSYVVSSSRGLLVNGGVDIKWLGGIIGHNQKEGAYLNSAATISYATIGDNSLEKSNTYSDVFVAPNIGGFNLLYNMFDHCCPS